MNEEIPHILETLTDPKTDYLSGRGITKRERIKRAILYLKARDAESSNHIKVLEHIFMGVKAYIPLVKGIKGGHKTFNIEELIETIEG